MNASMLDCVTINIMIHGTVVVKPYMALSKNKSQKTQILELSLGDKIWKQKILEDYILA